MSTPKVRWTTEDEKIFIDGLGLPVNRPLNNHQYHTNREQQLANYIAVSKKRKRWGNINAAEVIAYAGGKR